MSTNAWIVFWWPMSNEYDCLTSILHIKDRILKIAYTTLTETYFSFPWKKIYLWSKAICSSGEEFVDHVSSVYAF